MSETERSEGFFVVFDGPPSHESGRFVEVELTCGKSIAAGEWQKRDDGYWTLGPFYDRPQPAAAAAPELLAALQQIVDYQEPEIPLGDFYERTEACAGCEEWRQKKHPLQHWCHDHVREWYANRDKNAEAQAFQHGKLRDIARAAIAKVGR